MGPKSPFKWETPSRDQVKFLTVQLAVIPMVDMRMTAHFALLPQGLFQALENKVDPVRAIALQSRKVRRTERSPAQLCAAHSWSDHT